MKSRINNLKVFENKCSLLEKQLENMQSEQKQKVKKLNAKVEKYEGELIS